MTRAQQLSIYPITGYANALNSEAFEGNLQLMQSLFDAIQRLSEEDKYVVEVCLFYIKALQLLSVTTWPNYPLHISKPYSLTNKFKVF